MADAIRLMAILDAENPSEALAETLKHPEWQCHLAELVALKGLPTDAKYGPYDPYDHTVMGLDLAQGLLKDYHVPQQRRLEVMVSLLLHDSGKAENAEGHHTEKSVALAHRFLRRFGWEAMERNVTEMIRLHRRMLELPTDAPDDDFRALLDCVDNPLDLLIMTAANRKATEKELGRFEGPLLELPEREQVLYHRFRRAA